MGQIHYLIINLFAYLPRKADQIPIIAPLINKNDKKKSAKKRFFEILPLF